jgi:hypothetical protein
MIPIYYIGEEPDDDGVHEVHKDTCYRLPVLRRYLGIYASCGEAVARARTQYEGAAGCRLCSYECRKA